MIAPLRTDKKPPASRRLLAARAMIAEMFLPASEHAAPPLATWKAWLFVAWIALALTVYALSMGVSMRSAALECGDSSPLSFVAERPFFVGPVFFNPVSR